MKKLTFRFLIAAAFAICFATACEKGVDDSGNSSNTDYSELNAKIASLEQQIKNMQKTVDDLTQTVTASDEALKKELEAKITAVQDAVDAIKSTGGSGSSDCDCDFDFDFDGLLDRIGKAEASIDDIQSAVVELKNAVGDVRTAVDNVEAALADSNAELSGRIDGIVSRFDDIDSRFADIDSRLDDLAGKVDDKVNEAHVKAIVESFINDLRAELTVMVGDLKAELKGELAALNTELTACQEAIAGLTVSISGLQNQIDAMQSVWQSALDGKIDRSTYEEFVQQTNAQMQTTSAMLSELLALCNGFGNQTIKEYIDTAIADVTSMLDDYVLKSAYETFIEEYGKTKEDLQSQIDSNKSKITELEVLVETLKEMIEQSGSGDTNLGDLTALTQRIGELTTRIDNLEKNTVTLEQMQAQFTKDNAAFLNSVNGILADALANDGVISAAIAQSAEALRQEYTEMINSLAERIGAMEGQIADLIHRIQSLVYVPKTSDGKIHIGTTYIEQTDADGNDFGGRIELTPTKKLEYRVSPADLRDYLLELPLECFSFYQEHVTRAAFEGSGMDEFHILKIEEGNGPGEIFITVENEHDFTHEDLAVALCIRHTSDNGVVTEFTSPYTTVIGEGRNIRDRFYLAKQYNGEWVVCRDDNISYLLRYNDTASTIAFKEGEYYVVYDSGERVMTLDEAKEKFEWQVDLKASAVGIEKAFSTSGLAASSYALTPTSPNNNRSTPVTFKLKGEYPSNVRAKVSDKYCVSLSDGTNTVTLIPEVNVTITIIGTSYTVDAGEVVWDYSTWNAGRTNGSTSYQTGYCNIKSTSSTSDRTTMSHIPDSDMSEIFARNAEWNVTKVNGEASTIKGDISVTSSTAQVDGSKRNIQFTVNGYLCNDGTERISLSRTVKPSHLVGSEGIEITSEISLVAPAPKTVTVNASALSTTAKDFMFYFNVNDAITAKDKIPSYTTEEINKFFGKDKGHVSSMLSIGSPSSNTPWSSSDGYSLPVKAELTRNDETGSLIVANALTAYPTQITPALPAGFGTYTFTAPDDYFWHIANGPTIRITGTATITKTE